MFPATVQSGSVSKMGPVSPTTYQFRASNFYYLNHYFTSSFKNILVRTQSVFHKSSLLFWSIGSLILTDTQVGFNM